MSVVAATVALTMCSAAAGAAQSPWKPDRPVEIIDPGSGFDRTARLLQKIWQTKRVVEQSVTVVNKPGGNGALLTNNIISSAIWRSAFAIRHRSSCWKMRRLHSGLQRVVD
jgi:tripartite-type tricarboxylate transporter receptor subunit TctC